MELTAEEVADGGEIWSRFGSAELPFALKIILRLLGADVGHGDEADFWELGGFGFEVAVVGLADFPLHVGLAGANPDFADEHILYGQLILAGDGERVRPADGERVERDLPFAFVVGLGGVPLAGDRDDHVLGWISPAPNAVFLALLEDHVVGEDGREADIGEGGDGPEGEDGNEQAVHGGFLRVRNAE